MKNKQHEFILKAFIESAVPRSIRLNSPDLIMIDSVLGGYSTQLLQGSEQIVPIKFPVITMEHKKMFSTLIGGSTGKEKELLGIYYLLAILTEAVILQYIPQR